MMRRRRVLRLGPLCLIAVLVPGCVWDTEPLSDPDKAEPDKRLLGKWEESQGLERWEIDSPAVKSNPKGLMRAVAPVGRAEDTNPAFWFSTTTIGKDTYATIYFDCKRDKSVFYDYKYADFLKEGAFEKWNKENERFCSIVRFALDGDKLTVDSGSEKAVNEMRQRFERAGNPRPRLATYLEKFGTQTLFDGSNVREWLRPEAAEKQRTAEAEARRAEAEVRRKAREAREARWKAQEEAARKTEQEAARKTEQRKAEQRAASYLVYAKKLAARGMIEKAKGRLREIVEEFPTTEAAKEAKQLLDKLSP